MTSEEAYDNFLDKWDDLSLDVDIILACVGACGLFIVFPAVMFSLLVSFIILAAVVGAIIALYMCVKDGLR